MHFTPRTIPTGVLIAALVCAVMAGSTVRAQSTSPWPSAVPRVARAPGDSSARPIPTFPATRAAGQYPDYRRAYPPAGVVPASASVRLADEWQATPAETLPPPTSPTELADPPHLANPGDDLDRGEQPRLPPTFRPWWQPHVCRRLRAGTELKPVDLDWLLINTLAHSYYVRAISQDVLIHETEIVEAQAAFDVRAFMESKFVRTSDPVGSLLDTGGPPRLREEDWRFSGGWRKKTPLGGSFEASQQIGTRDSNSRFFVPPQQGNARLAISFNQPLLNGAGRTYNTALIVLADIDSTTALDRASQALQEHLLRVAQAYWDLYLQRAVLLQKQRHLQQAEQILDQLQRRGELDALQSQIVRARAAVAARQAERFQTAATIRNLEARLRSLTGAPELLAASGLEMLPQDRPASVPVHVNLHDALVAAVRHRPEVDAASQEIRAASVRLQMSQHELLPALDLVLETYVSGLEPDLNIGQSWVDQFSTGEPSYTAGLVFEVPLGRRTARARVQRRQLQLRQLTQQFEQTMQALQAEVEVAVRTVHATYDTLYGRYHALVAAETEADYASKRWQLFAGEDRAASFLLEDLLDAQDRLAAEEARFAEVQRDYTLSLIELKRTTGTLLQHEQIYPIRTCVNGLPDLEFEKGTGPVRPADVLNSTPEPRQTP